MVFATAVPRKNAARKLKAAAHATANLGDSTRVETTVAMLLAESWKPFRKSKISATRTVMGPGSGLYSWQSFKFRVSGFESEVQIRHFEDLNLKLETRNFLCALEDYGFDDVGGVFGFIGRVLEDFVQLFQLDKLNRIFFMLKKIGDSSVGSRYRPYPRAG